MRASQFVKGFFRKRYGISFVLVPESSDDLLVELSEAKRVLVEWAGNYGSKANMVLFTVMLDAELEEACEVMFRRFVAEDSELASFFQQVHVELLMPRTRGKPEKTVTLNATQG